MRVLDFLDDCPYNMYMTKPEFVHQVHQVAFHRNGIGGAPVTMVVFDHDLQICASCPDGGDYGWKGADGVVKCLTCKGSTPATQTLRMLATVFDAPGHVAVIAIDRLNDPSVGVAYVANSWRGDRFEPELRAAIEAHQSDGSFRLGPFAIPTERNR